MPSASTLTFRRKPSVLLQRKCRIRPVVETDMRWLWAAYKMDTWDGRLFAGMTQDTFTEDVISIITAADVAHIIEAPGDRGLQPVGIVLARVFGKGRCLEPHVDWFPWSTVRNRMEGSAHYLKSVGRQFKIFLFIDQENLQFWERIHDYRLLTRGCKVIDHYGPGEHAMMFYTLGT
jgi:hypothetical protein